MGKARIDYGDLPDRELTKKAEETVKFAEQLIEYAIRGKRDSGVVDEYKKSIEYYKGNHKIKLRNTKKGNLVWNKFAQTFDHRVTEITEADIKWKFDPIEESDIFTSYPLSVVLNDVVLENTGWHDGKAEEALIECAHAGSVHIKTIANTENGMANFIVVPLRSIFPDPLAKNTKQLRFIIHLIAKSVEEIKRDYGVEVQPEYTLLKDDDQYKDYQYTFQALDSDPNKGVVVGIQSEDERQELHVPLRDAVEDTMGMAVIAEIWLEDYTLEKIPFSQDEIETEHNMFKQGLYKAVDPEENHFMHIKAHETYLNLLDPIANEEQYKIVKEHINNHLRYDVTEYRRKYPNGRIITVCQGKLLRDEPNPLPIHWRDVFIKFDWYKVPGQYWGKNLGHDVFDPQDAFNHRKNSITKNINNLNNGIYKVRIGIWDKIFGRGNKKKITNLDGYAIPVTDPNDVNRDFGPPMPGHIFQEMIHTENFIDSTQAMQGVMAGIYPKGSPPDITVQRLLEQGQKPLKAVLKHYAAALKKMAHNAIKIMYEFMPDEYYLKIVGEDNKAKAIKWEDLKNGGILDIKISVEPSLATTRQEMFNRALALRREGIYTDSAVLKAIDDPLKYEVMQEKNLVMQLNATVQQLLAELDKKDKQLNTIMNRLQGKVGEGNVGETKTTD